MDLSLLEGRHILVPVTAQRRHLAERLAQAGAVVEEVEFIAIEPSSEPEALEEATIAWCAGDFDWLAVTSRNALSAMDAIARRHSMSLAAPQPQAKVATVGEATRAVCADLGLDVELVPSSRQNARGIVEEFAGGPGKVLAPLGNLAAPVLARGLERKGWTVTTVEAYRTVDGSGVGKQLREEIESGRFDAVLLTSGSVAQRLADSGAAVPEETLVVAIGDMTAATARAAGLELASVATAPSYDGIVAGLLAALDPDRLEEYDANDGAEDTSAEDDAGQAADAPAEAGADVTDAPVAGSEASAEDVAADAGAAEEPAWAEEPDDGSAGAGDASAPTGEEGQPHEDEGDPDTAASDQSFDDIIAGAPQASSPPAIDGDSSFDDIVSGPGDKG
ncbi:uroporphyrinogen-III synthase [Demequina sp. NBRC 110053]|uniref:uroporphyrinogen-III synthase n=1 Tax=Demequina sp. NBRC 110053 TaxID=1570342 RepID=UPI0009FD0A4C|nr:uroporphyrinogen-III synthase [Demequina sp. NBRC 110053]